MLLLAAVSIAFSLLLYAASWAVARSCDQFVGVGDQLDDWRHNPVILGVKVLRCVDVVLPAALERFGQRRMLVLRRAAAAPPPRAGRQKRSAVLRHRGASPAGEVSALLETGQSGGARAAAAPSAASSARQRHTLLLFLVGQLFFNAALTAFVAFAPPVHEAESTLRALERASFAAAATTTQVTVELRGAELHVAKARAADRSDVERGRDTEIFRSLCRMGVSVPPFQAGRESLRSRQLVWEAFGAADLDGSGDIDRVELRGGIAELVRAANVSKIESGLGARDAARARSVLGVMADFDDDDTSALDIDEFRAFIASRWRALFEHHTIGGGVKGANAENFAGASAMCSNATATGRRRCVCERLSRPSLRHVAVNVLGHAYTHTLFSDPEGPQAEATEWCLMNLGAIAPLDPPPELAAATKRAESVRESQAPNVVCLNGTFDTILVRNAEQRLIDPLIAFLETVGREVSGDLEESGLGGDLSSAALFERFQLLRNTAIAEAARVTRCGASEGMRARHIAKLRARFTLTSAQARCAANALALSLWADLWIADTKRKAEERLADRCKHWSEDDGNQLEDVVRHFEQYARVVHEMLTPPALKAWVADDAAFTTVERAFHAWEHSGMSAALLQGLDENALFAALRNATEIARSGCRTTGV